MSKKNRNVYPETEFDYAPAPRRSIGRAIGKFFARLFLLLFTVILLLVGSLCLIMNLVFNGPSPAARNVLTMSLLEPSATKWIPGLFMGSEAVEAIRNAGKTEMEETTTDISQVTINRNNSIGGSESHEWDNSPDGVRFEEYKGKTFNAHIMIVKDPSQVFLGISAEDGKFSTSVPGLRLSEAMDTQNARGARFSNVIAAVNAGAFNDDGTANATVGSVPAGLTVSGGKVVSDQYKGLVPEQGFCGFNEDDILVVAKSMTAEEAVQKKIRDGCEFGPVLIINGSVNQEVYNGNSGYNPRTAMGQRADGAVIIVCADGRQAGSLGATYRDIIDIMVEYGAVNACNMDGGSSSIMLYRDVYNRFPDASVMCDNNVKMMNSYSVLQSQPRRMPDFWMVKSAE